MIEPRCACIACSYLGNNTRLRVSFCDYTKRRTAHALRYVRIFAGRSKLSKVSYAKSKTDCSSAGVNPFALNKEMCPYRSVVESSLCSEGLPSLSTASALAELFFSLILSSSFSHSTSLLLSVCFEAD